MASLGTVSIDVAANLAGINRQFDNLNRRLSSLGRNARGSQSAVSSSTIAIGNAYAMMAQLAVKALTKVIDMIVKLIKKTIELATASTKMAIEYESSMIVLKNIFGSASSVIEDFANTQARALNISKRSAIEYGNTFGGLLLNIGLAKKETAGWSVELLKAAAVIQSNNARFTMEVVLEKMRSGILGNVAAIDDLKIEAKVGMLQATDAFKKFANGRAWSQIPFQTQQIIRLLGILEQKTNIYGDTLAKTTNTALTKFKVIMEDAGLALGQALLPLVQMAIPIMIRFAQAIEFAAIKIKQFSELLFGSNEAIKDSSEEAADGQKKIADGIKKTSDEARKSLAPFDKLNNMQEKMAGGGETGIPNLPAPKDSGLGAIADTSLGKIATTLIKELSKALKDFNVELKKLAELTKPILKPLAKQFEFFALGTVALGTKIIRDYTKVLEGLNAVIIITKGIFKKAFGDAKKDAEITFTDINKIIVESKDEAGKVDWNQVRTKLSEKLDPTKDDVKATFEELKKNVTDSMTETGKINWTEVRKKVGEHLKPVRRDAKTLFGDVKDIIEASKNESGKIMWDEVKTKMQEKLGPVLGNTDQLFKDVKTAIEENKTKAGEIDWTTVEKNIIEDLKPVEANTKTILDNIYDKFIGSKIKLGKIVWSTIWRVFKDEVKSAIGFAIKLINGFLKVVDSIKITTPGINIGATPFTPAINIPQQTFGFSADQIDTDFLNTTKADEVKPFGAGIEQSPSGVELLGGTSVDKVYNVILKVGETELARQLINPLEKEKERIGQRLLGGVST